MLSQDTIAAIATPHGSGAIGMVRMSGPDALSVADRLMRREGFSLSRLSGYRATHSTIVDPATGERLDDAVVIVYRAPGSYTGEDIVELCCHGGSYLLSRVLRACLDAGARLAAPGEFTYRAYLNGKMDLAQAEAVADLIEARTSAALRAANRLHAGALSQVIGALRDALLDACSSIEAAIETDEEDMVDAEVRLRPDLIQLHDRIGALVSQGTAGRAVREGYRVAIVGRPNVGKSTLFNAMLRRSRAIVSPSPGTTRDTIEETVEMGGIAVTLIDTAGLRRARGIAETMGVERTEQAINESDAVLLVLSATSRPTATERDLTRRLGTRCLAWLVNKTDTLSADQVDTAIARLRTSGGPSVILPISATTPCGLEDVEQHIVQTALEGSGDMENLLVTHERHVQALIEAHLAVRQCLTELDRGMPLDVCSVYLKEAADALAQVIGATLPEDVIARLFSRFCMGK